MNHDKSYSLKEVYRHLEISLIGIPDANRTHVERAIECLNKYNKMLEMERMK